jgi:hypothetical protein
MKDNSNNGVPVGAHLGKVMYRLARNYGDVPSVAKEIVQNAIDSGALKIDVTINSQQRTMVVLDNGSGASTEKVTLALDSIGDTLKESDKFGQFGLGLISPISIASHFTFTTCPQPHKEGYRQYLFITKDIAKQRRPVIPGSTIPQLKHDPNGKTWWRTMVNVRGITKDKRTSEVSLEGLINDIALAFGEKIREKQINVLVSIIDENGKEFSAKVEAPEFSGESLGRVEFAAGEVMEAGKVLFDLYIARITKGGRKGNIAFGTLDNPSRITTKQFVVCTSHILKQEVAKALISGLFEGRILCQNIILHADRTRFEDNDALFALCEVLEHWWKLDGQKWIKKVEEDTDDERFQAIGNQAMKFGELLLKQPLFSSVFAEIEVGTITDDHTKVSRRKVIGPDEGKSLASVGPDKPGTRNGGRGGGPGEREKPTTEHPRHTPGPVYGPRGRVRTEVKGNSTGLRFSHVEMEDFRVPFTYEAKTGLLAFNMRHPNWGMCRGSDSFLREYHIVVITTALSLELFKGQKASVDPQVEKFAHESLTHTVFAIVNGKAVVG